MSNATPVTEPGMFALVLHSHLPWLANHGRWPVGEEWIYQSWAASYIPLAAALRRLADEGTTFRALVNEARSALAVDLLCSVGLTVEEVSRRLGYSETSTFCHAFKRWHGMPPSAFHAVAHM